MDSDKENMLNQLSGNSEDGELRRREMLEEISMMINEYKKKQSYDNMITNMATPMLPDELDDKE